MTRSLIAEFDSQFQAASSAAKLVSLGLPRDQFVLQTDERGLETPASSNASTSVPRQTLDEPGEQAPPAPHGRSSSGHGVRHAQAVRSPDSIGHARITIGLPCGMPESELVWSLTASGAIDVRRSNEPAPQPDPAARPLPDRAAATDVERAIEASRGRMPPPRE